MSDNLHLTEKEIQLLSAYLDGETTEQERAKAAALLATVPNASRFFENLRNLKSLLRLLPVRKVPRNYILTRQEAAAMAPGWVFKGLRVISGISAAALAAVLAFDFLVPFRAAAPTAMLESAPMEAMVAEEAIPTQQMEKAMAEDVDEEMAVEMEEEGEPLVFSYQARPQGMGIGGGGGGGGEGMPAVPSQPGLILPDISIKLGDALPQEDAVAEEIPEALEMEAAPAMEEREGDAGPILGVRPSEEQGQITKADIPAPLPHAEQPQPSRMPSYLVLEVALLAVALSSALAAVLIRRRRRTAR